MKSYQECNYGAKVSAKLLGMLKVIRLTGGGAGREGDGERGVEVVVLVLRQVQPLLLDVHQLALRTQVCNAEKMSLS